MPLAVEYADVQGMLRFGFAKMSEACYLLLTIRDPGAARAWLRQAPVTTAEEMSPAPSTALQIGLTRQGLEHLQVPERVIAGFSLEFLSGMSADENRSRRLGDMGANAPRNWSWGAEEKVPHVVVMLFAEPGKLADWQESVKRNLWQAAFEEIACLSTSNLGGREHFGFIDGISQPQIDWQRSRTVSVNGNQLSYGNLVSIGEFVLGYPNEYNRYTERPLLDPKDPGTEDLLQAEDQPDKKDLGRNGSYVVIRQLAQDVRTFWQYQEQAARSISQTGSRVAEAMLGRAIADGAPLVPLSDVPMEGVGDVGNDAKRKLDNGLNRFTYASDPDGTRCPFGSHIRRGNPRSADLPGNPRGLIAKLIHILGFGNANLRADLTASVRFHRVLRRGREYGPGLSPEQALQSAPAGDPERGLHFVALNANIERQFEFVQNAWMAQTKFDGMTEESDPLLGNRQPVAGCPFTNTFSMPQEGKPRKRLMGVPAFVTVRGGAYFFLPGIRALKYLSSAGGK